MWRRLRRGLRYLPVLAGLGALGWAAPPALSVSPYLPAAEDFGHELPATERVDRVAARLRAADRDGHAHQGEGPVTHRSPAVEAPKRFDLAGLAGELRPYEIRARTEDGGWSDWIETADGNPVYFGEADEVQVRTRGWRPTGRLHYVNVSGTTTLADRILNGARSAINEAFITAAALVAPTADAAVKRPNFITRGDWGANRSNGGCKPRREASLGKDTRAGVVHHTVTGNGYSRAQAPGIVLGICRFHRNGNGWDDIGYNALTDRFGRLYIGRAGGVGKPVIGAHSQGFNRQTTGIAVLGTHTSRKMSRASRRAFGRFLAWRLRGGKGLRRKVRMKSLGGSVNRHPKGRVIRVQRIIPHRRLNTTACPGNRGKRHLPNIRDIAVRIRRAHS